jgi:zona occludens toxin
MISVVYGVPGSGKTYYAVHWIKKKALTEGDIFLRVRSDVILITNLKLNLDATDGYIFIEDIKGFAKYMDVDFWKANLHYVQGKRIVFVIDECQLFFYHYKDDPKVLFFLQYHRHLSVDILLITQTPKSLPAKVFELSEFLIEAVPKSVNPFGFRAFRYRVLHPFDRDVVLRRFHLAFDPVLFYLYSDMIYKHEEGEEKPRNAFTRYYVLVASFLLLTVFLMFSFFSHFSSSASLPSQVKSQSVPSQSPAVQPVPVQYEDLITEEKQDNPKHNPKPSESPKPSDSPVDSPKSPEGSYYLVISKPASDSPKDPLDPSVKVIEIP